MTQHRSIRSIGVLSRRGAAGALLAAGVVVLATGAGTAVASPAATASESAGTCRSGTLTAYGHRTSCLKGSFYDRIRVGSIDSTFAIRGDRAVIYASANHGWVRVSTGKADYVKWVDADRNGFQGVCVETKAGNAYYSSYDRHRGWLKFTPGCDG